MLPSEPATRVGYVLKVYPRFSETFVVTEILAREAAGQELDIFALRPTTDTRFHPEIARVQAPVHHLPKPVKLSDSWARLAQARLVLPDFDTRFAALLPMLTRLEATEVVQGVDLAVRAHERRITHLHAHFASMASRVAFVAAGLLAVPFSVTTHAKDLFHDGVDRALLGDVLGAAAHVVAISDYNRSFLLTEFPELTSRTVLIHNGLELDRFPYADPAPPGTPLRVLGVGRLVEKKGFSLLVDAAARLAAAGQPVQVRIAGEGDLRTTLQQQIDTAGLTGQVTLTGPRSQAELQDLLRWADVMTAPCVVGADGNADGLPTVLLEAMAMGVPVIASDVTGIPEAVHNGAPAAPATGQLIPTGNLDAMVEALRQVARPDHPRIAQARAARALVERHFDARVQSALLSGLHTRPDARQAAPVAAAI